MSKNIETFKEKLLLSHIYQFVNRKLFFRTKTVGGNAEFCKKSCFIGHCQQKWLSTMPDKIETFNSFVTDNYLNQNLFGDQLNHYNACACFFYKVELETHLLLLLPIIAILMSACCLMLSQIFKLENNTEWWRSTIRIASKQFFN